MKARFFARIAALEKTLPPVELALHKKYFDHVLGEGAALTPEELEKLDGWILLDLIPIDDEGGHDTPANEGAA